MWKKLLWIFVFGLIAVLFMTRDNTPLVELEARQGMSQAQLSLALMYATGEGKPQDYQQAHHWFERAAQAGVKQACFNLGLLHYRGLGTPADKTKAQHWYHQSLASAPPTAVDMDQVYQNAQWQTLP